MFVSTISSSPSCESRLGAGTSNPGGVSFWRRRWGSELTFQHMTPSPNLSPQGRGIIKVERAGLERTREIREEELGNPLSEHGLLCPRRGCKSRRISSQR